MATTTTSDVRLAPLPPAAGRAGLRGAIASEFTKLRSVRSTYWTLGALLLVAIGIGIAVTAGIDGNFANNPGQKGAFDATQTSLIPFFGLGQLVIAVLGAMVITSEYSTGMIRTSLAAQPRRGVVYAAKAIVFGSITLVVSLVTSFIAFLVGQALLSGSGVSASLLHGAKVPANVMVGPGPGGPNGPPAVTYQGHLVASASTVLTAVIGCALFVTIVALIAFGVGAIIRHTAGAICTVIAMMFVVPLITAALPNTWRWDILRFLPDGAGRVISVTIGGTNPHLWSAWPQLGVTALYAVVLVGIGAYLFRKRDA
jgi:ABC-2 type transport system permease protein